MALKMCLHGVTKYIGFLHASSPLTHPAHPVPLCLWSDKAARGQESHVLETLVCGPDKAGPRVRRSWRRLAQRWEYLARWERLQWLLPMGRQPARSRMRRVLQPRQSRNNEQLHAWAHP